MSRPDALDTELRKLALQLVKAALTGPVDDDHKARVETLKVAGNFAVAAKRGKKGNDDENEGDTMNGIRQRLAEAETAGGHA